MVLSIICNASSSPPLSASALAADRHLTLEQQAGLWHVIDARAWLVEMIAKDYDTELAGIEAQLEADLRPSHP